MFTKTWRFEAAGRPWRVTGRSALDGVTIRVFDGDALAAERQLASTDPTLLDPQTIMVDAGEGPLEITFGYLDWFTLGCVARFGGVEIYRSSKRPFAEFRRIKAMNAQSGATLEEREAAAQRAKDRMPSVYVDIGMGILFFLVAQRFGLPTAAVTGAAITLVLFIAQRFMKVNLLGGFAVFGVALSLLSAGAAIAFQSDLAVKLRGTVIGLVGATAFLMDGAFGGRYLGRRLVGYLETLIRIRPSRASLAMGSAGIAIAAIDLAAAFGLPTNLWLIYNAFLDGFIAMPLVFGALWLARERASPS